MDKYASYFWRILGVFYMGEISKYIETLKRMLYSWYPNLGNSAIQNSKLEMSAPKTRLFQNE